MTEPELRRKRISLTASTGRVTQRIGALEKGYDSGEALPVEDDEVAPPAGVILMATLHAEPVGRVCLTVHGGEPAELKRMWVTEKVRGQGAGRRPLAEVEAYASGAGVRALRPETTRVLGEAIGLYTSAGFRETTPSATPTPVRKGA